MTYSLFDVIIILIKLLILHISESIDVIMVKKTTFFITIISLLIIFIIALITIIFHYENKLKKDDISIPVVVEDENIPSISIDKP